MQVASGVVSLIMLFVDSDMTGRIHETFTTSVASYVFTEATPDVYGRC